MKDKVKPLSNILLIIIFLFTCGHQVFGQEKVNVSAGVGFPELFNIGVRYQLDQAQIGLGVGGGDTATSIYGDLRFHFGGFSKLSNRLPWYARIGLNYLRDENDYSIDKYLFLNTRFGREFNITNKIGIEIDLGVIFQLSHDEIEKQSSSDWFDSIYEGTVLPSFGIGLFYRI